MTKEEKNKCMIWISDLYAAAACGKIIQTLIKGEWVDCDYADHFPTIEDWKSGLSEDFRVKPKAQRKWEVNNKGIHGTTHSKSMADAWKAKGYPVTEWVEVV